MARTFPYIKLLDSFSYFLLINFNFLFSRRSFSKSFNLQNCARMHVGDVQAEMVSALRLSSPYCAVEAFLGGADVNTRDPSTGIAVIHLAAQRIDDPEIVQQILEQTVDINLKTCDGLTPLMIATKSGSRNWVFALLERGAEVNAQDVNGRRVLSKVGPDTGRSIVEALLEHGARVDFVDKFGKTQAPVFHAAVKTLGVKVVTELLRQGFSANLRCPIGYFPVHMTIFRDNMPMLTLLVEHGGDIRLHDHYGRPVIHLAVESQSLRIVRTVIRLGGDIEERDSRNSTPIFRAAENNQSIMVAELIRLGANIEARDVRGYTPILAAAKRGAHRTVQILGKLGANLKARDLDGANIREIGGRFKAVLEKLEALGVDENVSPARRHPIPLPGGWKDTFGPSNRSGPHGFLRNRRCSRAPKKLRQEGPLRANRNGLTEDTARPTHRTSEILPNK
ncbi:unnamed protein product [Caenorhabditis auriculariae]|uniref:Uncharacterized protein n=1 Tax=Caenorhabditis auriculariae TaxID=2777116 RepID=A0A8S1HSV3_9PELO|nr:unnamed protein product [Caenorhabditis auriculariae]